MKHMIVPMIAIGALVTGLGEWVDQNSPLVDVPGKEMSSGDAMQGVNIQKHLTQTQLEHRVRALSVDMENAEKAPRYDSHQLSKSEEVDRSKWGVDLRQEDGVHQAMEDLKRGEEESRGILAQTPEQVVLQEVARREWLNQYDRLYRKEFVQTFLENAKRAGYLIRLDENLEVIGVQKIQNPRDFSTVSF